MLTIQIDTQDFVSYQKNFYLNSKVAAFIILGELKYKGGKLTIS